MKFTITMPTAADPLGKWMEAHGAVITLACVFGKYTAEVAWKKVHSYNDTDGQHSETWSLDRTDPDPTEAIAKAVKAAMERAK